MRDTMRLVGYGLCAAAFAVHAQDDGLLPKVAYPSIVEHAATPEAFVPAGWRIEHRIAGRLDADDRDDALLLLRMDDPSNVVDNAAFGPPRFDTNPRMLVALLAGRDGGWRRVMADHAVIPRPDAPSMDDYLGDDPAAAIVIHPNRTWSVQLHSWASAGSWYTSEVTFTFRLEGDCMRLVGHDRDTTHRGSGETTTDSTNYLTGRASLQTGSIDDNAPGPARWTRLASKQRVCIEDVGNGFDFEPARVPLPDAAASERAEGD